MKIKGLERLTSGGQNYDINVEVMSGFKKDEIAVKAFLTLFNAEGKITRKATAISSNQNFDSAQKQAIELVIERAGV